MGDEIGGGTVLLAIIGVILAAAFVGPYTAILGAAALIIWGASDANEEQD